MAGPYPKPKISRDSELLRASYRLPHLVYTAKVYPVTSPNGSTIIVYGHANGIRVLWNGGRPFKPSPPEPPKNPPKANDPQNDVVMILDSDEEEPPPKALPDFKDEPQFEEEEEEADPLNPFPTTIQYLDLTFGTDVLHISFPPLPSSPSSLPSPSSPIVCQRIVMAVTCSDHTVRIITLPLMPPSPAKKRHEELRAQTRLACPGDGTWGEQVLTLGGPLGHEDIPTDVSITLTPRTIVTETKNEEVEGVPNVGAIVTARNQKTDPTLRSGDQEWDVLVASISSEASGVLFVYRIPILAASPTFRLSTEHTVPTQTQYLPSHALAISFNPSPHSSKRHSHLLVADSTGCVRLYDYSENSSNSSSDRQTPIDSALTSTPGSWLVSLHLGFENLKLRDSRGVEMPAHATKPKQFLDVKWVLGGKAILVLMSTGEWGIWDVEAAGPAAEKVEKSNEPIRRRGIQGGSKTMWNLCGRIEVSMPAPQLSRSSSKKNEGPVKFAPRTPRTRKVEEQIFFSGNFGGGFGHTRGRIAVRPSAMTTSWRAGSETIVFWFAGVLAIIPDLWTFWENQLGKSMNGGIGNLFDSDGRGRMVKFDGVQIREETISDVDIFPNATEKSSSSRLLANVVISGGHHLVFLSGRHSEPEIDLDTSIGDDGHNSQMTVAGDLDKIDQALVQMEMGRREKRPLGAVTKKVGFVGLP